MIVSFKASPPKNSKNPFLLNLVVGYDKSYHYSIKMAQNAMVIFTCHGHFHICRHIFFVLDLISDNFWSKCEGVDCVSLFEVTIFMFVDGDIEH